MTDLLALDPSVRSPGMAIFRDNALIFAGRLTKLGSPGDFATEGARWQFIAEQIVGWAREHDCIFPSKIVYERPQIYVAAKSKGDPNDLIALAAIGAAVCAYFQAQSAAIRIAIDTPTPAQWAGQIPKATKGSAKDSPRALRILSRLTEGEKCRAPNQHDALDAIGLGLHALDRLGIRKVFSNGRDGH